MLKCPIKWRRKGKGVPKGISDFLLVSPRTYDTLGNVFRLQASRRWEFFIETNKIKRQRSKGEILFRTRGCIWRRKLGKPVWVGRINIVLDFVCSCMRWGRLMEIPVRDHSGKFSSSSVTTLIFHPSLFPGVSSLLFVFLHSHRVFSYTYDR